MARQWLLPLLLLLLLIKDGAFNMPDVTYKSDGTTSREDSTPKGAKLHSSIITAISNSGTINISSVTLKILPEFQKHTPPTPPTSLIANISNEFTKQTNSVHETAKKTLDATTTTISKGTTLSNSTFKDQAGTFRSTTSSHGHLMTTSSETTQQNKNTPTAAPLTSRSTFSELESTMYADTQRSVMTRIPTALNSLDNIMSPGSMTTTVSKKSASISPILSKTTNMLESFFMRTSAVNHTTSLTLTTVRTIDLKTTMSGTQKGDTIAISPTSTTATIITSTNTKETIPTKTNAVNHTTSLTLTAIGGLPKNMSEAQEGKTTDTPLTSTTTPTNTIETSPTTTGVANSSTSLTMTTTDLGTTDLNTSMSGAQKEETTATLPASTTTAINCTNSIETLPITNNTVNHTTSLTLTTLDGHGTNMCGAQEKKTTDNPPTSTTPITPTTIPTKIIDSLLPTAKAVNQTTSLETIDLKTIMFGTHTMVIPPYSTVATITPTNTIETLPTTTSTANSTTSLTMTTLGVTDTKTTMSGTHKGEIITTPPNSTTAAIITSTNTKETVPTKTSAVNHTTSLTLTTLGGLQKNMSGAQEGKTTDIPLTTPTNTIETLPSSTSAANSTTSLTMTILRTTDLKTITSETQKGDTTATPPTSTAVTTAPTNTIETFPTTTSVSNSTTSLTLITLGTTDLKTVMLGTQKEDNSAMPSGSTTTTTITPTNTIETLPKTTSAVNSTTSLTWTVLSTTNLKTTISETQKGDITATPPTSTIATTTPTNTIESLLKTTSVANSTTSLNLTDLGTTDLKTTLSESQKGENTATSPTSTILPNPATAPTVSTLSETHDDLIIQTPFQLVESVPSIGTTIAQSPETTTAHSTTLISSSSWITKSSAMTETTNVSKGTQSSSPGAGICALDEYPAIRGVCMCNDSYYAHSELSRMVVTLHCQPQKIEVALRSCFLKTHHWILRDHAFSGCSSVSKIEEGHRVQIFMIEKKEGVCGLELSTNHSHALYSLEVQLLQVLSDSAIRDATTLNFSCVYPLVVDVSQTQPYPVVIQTHAFPYSTVHVPGIGDTIVILGIFTDPQQSSPLENRPVPLGTSLYVVLRATSSDPERFTLVVNEVFASTNASRTGAVKGTYHFVKASCPVSNHLTGDLNNNGNSLEVTLAFNLIRFLTSDTIYLHGRVTLCNKLAGHRCQPTCTQKSPPAGNKARSVVQERKRGLENSSGWLMFGPIQITGNWIIVESSASKSKTSAGVWMAIFLVRMIGWML